MLSFCSVNGREIQISPDEREFFDHNLIHGDNISIKNGIQGVFVGSYGGYPWIKPIESKYIIAVAQSTNISIVSRPNHVIERCMVDGKIATVDRTESFCMQYGYSLCDLVSIPRKGICEIYGVFSSKLVLRNFESDSLFSSQIMSFQIIRSFSKKTRKVNTADKGLIDVSIYANDRIFLPSDRVHSPYGDSTIIGFDNGIYILTDNAKYHGGTAIKVAPFELSLIRRIGLPANRSISIAPGKKAVVSLSTDNRVDGMIAGDIVKVCGNVFRALGCAEGKLFGENLTDGNIIEIPSTAALMFRSDILGSASGIEVGSPAFDLSPFLPGDLISSRSGERLIYGGIGPSGPQFASECGGSVSFCSYSSLLLPYSYNLIERKAYRTN